MLYVAEAIKNENKNENTISRKDHMNIHGFKLIIFERFFKHYGIYL